MQRQLLAFGAVLVMAIAAVGEEDWHLHGGSQTDQRSEELPRATTSVSFSRILFPSLRGMFL